MAGEKPKVKLIITGMSGEVLDEFVVSPFLQQCDNEIELSNAIVGLVGHKFEMATDNG